MIADRADALLRKGLDGLRGLAERGLATPRPPTRGPVTMRRMVGLPPGSLSGAVSGLSSTAALFVMFLLGCGVVWVMSKVGVWAIVGVTWVGAIALIYYHWDRLDFGRVRAALRDEPEGDQP